MKAVATRRGSRARTEPLRHAARDWTGALPGRTTYEALCGAQVAISLGPWQPDHARNCAPCTELARVIE